MLDEETPSVLAAVRLDKARECLQAAEKNLLMDLFQTSVNRSYYCIFHAMRAVLALERFDSKKHSGVISQFRKNYIKPGIFPTELSYIITNAFKDRNDCDYMDFYAVSKDDASSQFESAKVFLGAVDAYITPKLHNPLH
ncbi:MAG: HEPN domain-containing protein [Chitinispirillales bacterium]|jgi:uncharacterized protein (UPF0332 family)|nr:HEPN domain-containing protein [Chitinispirillales bacterium]